MYIIQTHTYRYTHTHTQREKERESILAKYKINLRPNFGELLCCKPPLKANGIPTRTFQIKSCILSKNQVGKKFNDLAKILIVCIYFRVRRFKEKDESTISWFSLH